MKVVLCLQVLCCLLFSCAHGAGVQAGGDKTITKVVKLLQSMLDQSKKDADEEALLYAKYKCYCDKTTLEKETFIDEKTKEIALLEAKIEKYLASTGTLSHEVAKLDNDMDVNKQKQDEATALREKEKAAYDALVLDLEQAIGQLENAINILSAVNADQNSGKAAADHTKFMSGYSVSLSALKTQVDKALVAASAFVPQEQRKPVLELAQKPFTGTYTSQSVEVMGILQNMLDTFKANLEEAKEKEKKAIAAYTALMALLEDEYNKMKSLYDEKQSQLSSNDDDLASSRNSLYIAREDKAEAEDFLAKLTDMCTKKKQEYEHRQMMRTNEDAAIAQAIAILNSDQAFALFGKVDATSTGATEAASFLQVGRGNRGQLDATSALVQRLSLMLRSKKSMKLAKVLLLVQKGNPFKVVLDEIAKMLKVIDEEGASDEEKLGWCNSERETTDKTIEEKSSQITTLTQRQEGLVAAIGDPETGGLKKQLADNAVSLAQNKEAKVTQTKDRNDEHAAYNLDVKNMVEAAGLLEKAITVLKTYYTELEAKLAGGASFVQKKDEPAPPASWKEGGYEGLKTDGNKAIEMLEFVLESTKKETNEAHKDEKDAQHAYEDSMADLMAEEATLQESRIKLEKELAEKEAELASTIEDLKKTTEEKEALEKYLASIKPGCDFITTNIDTRKNYREVEKKSLEDAKKLIEESPAYISAMAKAKLESFGKCRQICEAGEAKVGCKACMAGVSIPGYCAGHPDTDGC